MEKILFTADLHGNMFQYNKVFQYALENNTNIIIFGGDLTPKIPIERRTPQGQRDFLENELFPALKEFYDKSETHVLFVMGNDDFRSNHDLMVEGQAFYGYRMIDQIPYITKSGYTIMGYSYVPYTPFKYKCWERCDLNSQKDFSHRPEIRIEGVISQDNDLVPYSLESILSDHSIEDDMEGIASKVEDVSKLILISHAPPYNTVCDYTRHEKHVGSRAIRGFVENKQPFMTLHGHIHETVDLTGDFKENIGNTICASVGNDHVPETPFILEIQLEKQPKIERLRLV